MSHSLSTHSRLMNAAHGPILYSSSSCMSRSSVRSLFASCTGQTIGGSRDTGTPDIVELCYYYTPTWIAVLLTVRIRGYCCTLCRLDLRLTNGTKMSFNFNRAHFAARSTMAPHRSYETICTPSPGVQGRNKVMRVYARDRSSR